MIYFLCASQFQEQEGSLNQHMKGEARAQWEHQVTKEQVHLGESKSEAGLKEEDWMNWDVWATYKVQVWVVDRSLLPAEVGEDEERVYEVAGEAHPGQRNPDTQGQQGLDKACKSPEANAKTLKAQALSA